MEALKFDPEMRKLFEDCEVIPGNGYSPHTGFTVFKAKWIVHRDHNKQFVVKMGKRPLNNHKSILEEYKIIKEFKHMSIVQVYQSYHIRPNSECVVMEDLSRGGRRSRWREIIKEWSYHQLSMFIHQMFNIIFWLDSVGWMHGDIEFANIGIRGDGCMPVLFDFGRAHKVDPNPETVKSMLDLDVKSEYNAWARELFGIGGRYAEEGQMFSEKFIDSTGCLIEKIYIDRLNK